jgi:hypothetical protein
MTAAKFTEIRERYQIPFLPGLHRMPRHPRVDGIALHVCVRSRLSQSQPNSVAEALPGKSQSDSVRQSSPLERATVLQDVTGLAGVRVRAGVAAFGDSGPGFEKTASGPGATLFDPRSRLNPSSMHFQWATSVAESSSSGSCGMWPVSSLAWIGRMQRRHGWPTSGWSERSGPEVSSPNLRRLARDVISQHDTADVRRETSNQRRVHRRAGE